MKDMVQTLFPTEGEGFVTNNRGPDTHYGQSTTIQAAKEVARRWHLLHANRPMSVGQISKRGGGAFAPHLSHQDGCDVDVRPLRKDGANIGVDISSPQYDAGLTKELIELWWKSAPVKLVVFNDRACIAAGLSREHAGHGNHFHVRLRAFHEVIREGDRGSDVAEVQQRLRLTPDGRFGPNTTAAVKAFQKGRGLAADGVVGPGTWAALVS